MFTDFQFAWTLDDFVSQVLGFLNQPFIEGVLLAVLALPLARHVVQTLRVVASGHLTPAQLNNLRNGDWDTSLYDDAPNADTDAHEESAEEFYRRKGKKPFNWREDRSWEQ
jgi:hypothetical protein